MEEMYVTVAHDPALCHGDEGFALQKLLLSVSDLRRRLIVPNPTDQIQTLLDS